MFKFGLAIYFFILHDNKTPLMAKNSRFLVLYLIQAACLWLGLEVSTYLQGDALKVFLRDYWLLYYAIPLVTTGLVFKDVQNAPLSALIGWTERQCLAAYSEGQTAWRYNQFAFYFRRRWILCLVIAFVLVFLSLHVVFFPGLGSAAKNAIILFLAFVFLGANFFALRKRTMRLLDMQERLHQLAHQLRNEHSQLLRKLAAKDNASPEDILCHLSETLELSKEYVRIMIREKILSWLSVSPCRIRKNRAIFSIIPWPGPLVCRKVHGLPTQYLLMRGFRVI
ncbi:MAG: hypothetical protein D3910_06700 [Candidatus Electrothrix sp. ATG2]|nr:hypothetical protein [Candidatus Electrothrix sp. ATG2]